MIGMIAGWLLKSGAVASLPGARQAAKICVALGALLLLIATVFVWDRWDDHAAVTAANAERELSEARASLQAERRASAASEVREAARQSASEQTRSELETIHAEDPEAAAAPASRGARTVADRLPQR
jgi:hypothetical protein